MEARCPAPAGSGSVTATPPGSSSRPDRALDRVHAFEDPSAGWQWKVDVRGAGDAPAPASLTGLSRAGGPEILIDTPALAPGESMTVTAECQPGSLATATARADAGSAVDESDEGNNTRCSDPDQGIGGRCRYP